MAAEILIAFSLIWLIIWSFLGMIAGKGHPEWIQRMKSVAAEGKLDAFWESYDWMKVQSISHAHANNFACVTFLIGLAMNAGFIGFSSRIQLLIAIGLILSVVLSGFGDRLRVIILAGLGGILFLLMLILVLVGFLI